MTSFSSASFLERLRQGYRGYSKSSSLSFLDALLEHQERLPQRFFQRTAEAASMLKQKLSDAAIVKLKDATRLLCCEEDARLKLALECYHHQVRVETELSEVVTSLEEGGQESLEVPLRLDLEAFRNWYVEVSELYIYFAFLDLTGDRGLLELVVVQLETQLAISSSTLIASLKKTRSWAQSVWKMLARREQQELLQRRHAQALRSWLARAKEETAVSVAEMGMRPFWETSFSGLQKVAWYDFVDCVQEQFLRGFCPKDLLELLRRRMCDKACHHVTRQDWDSLLQSYGNSISAVLDMIVEEVLADIPSTVYRTTPVPSSGNRKIENVVTTKKRRGRPAPLRPGKEHGECELGRTGSDTPEDPRPQLEPGKKMDWDAYVDELATEPWWSSEALPEEDELRFAAVRAVKSELSFTRRVLILRVASGELAKGRPLLETRGGDASLPALLVCPNDVTASPGVTKFGRGAKRKMMHPDLLMTEPIASRSHFSISFDAKTERYEIMDAGSKWGTFLKVQDAELSCGDWLRIGNAELVIRYCGGTCKSKRHAERRCQSLMTRAMSSFPGLKSLSLIPKEDADEPPALNVLCGGRRPWLNCVEKMCLHAPLQSEKTRINRTTGPAPLPWAPMELDFVSGPRMGERFVVTERCCTIGRAETCTVQISDPMLANVSRTHCIIQNTAQGTRIMDNNSTNGTWRRLSCVLEASSPQELKSGACILAGVHEFRVEEAEMSRDWMPSVAGRTLQTLE